jgi:methionyl-tRNA synthetase
MATVLGVATQLVSDANTLLAPFLPHSSQAVHEAFGGTGTFAPMPVIEEVEDLDIAGRSYPIITGDYTAVRDTWRRNPVEPGTEVPAPTPVFTKLDDSIVEEELARMRGE